MKQTVLNNVQQSYLSFFLSQCKHQPPPQCSKTPLATTIPLRDRKANHIIVGKLEHSLKWKICIGMTVLKITTWKTTKFCPVSACPRFFCMTISAMAPLLTLSDLKERESPTSLQISEDTWPLTPWNSHGLFWLKEYVKSHLDWMVHPSFIIQYWNIIESITVILIKIKVFNSNSNKLRVKTVYFTGRVWTDLTGLAIWAA